MKRLLITGGDGVIGRVVASGLDGWELTPVDQADGDLADPEAWQRLLPGHDAVLHLAWHKTNYQSTTVHPDNFAMAEHLFQFAQAAGVKRVLYASSVHADDFYAWLPDELGEVVTGGTPTGAYGAAKLYGEALGRRAASAGLEVVSVRLGGVNAADTQPDDPFEASVWLSHADCRRIISRLLELKLPTSRYLIAYAVSQNPTRRHPLHPDLID